jgi:hypothetical protein
MREGLVLGLSSLLVGGHLVLLHITSSLCVSVSAYISLFYKDNSHTEYSPYLTPHDCLSKDYLQIRSYYERKLGL